MNVAELSVAAITVTNHIIQEVLVETLAIYFEEAS